MGLGFYIGDRLIPYYGFFIALGVVAAGAVGCLQVKLFRKDCNDFFILAGMVGTGGDNRRETSVSGGILGTDRCFSLTNPETFSGILNGGFVFYGGVAGGLLAAAACKKWLRVDTWAYAAVCIPCIPIAHAFGRFGCSAVGCCYGMPYEGPGHIVYTHSLFAPNNQPLFPVQAVEAVGELGIAAFLLFYIDTRKGRKNDSLWLYFTLYAILRFVLDMLDMIFRKEEDGALLHFTVDQPGDSGGCRNPPGCGTVEKRSLIQLVGSHLFFDFA